MNDEQPSNSRMVRMESDIAGLKEDMGIVKAQTEKMYHALMGSISEGGRKTTGLIESHDRNSVTLFGDRHTGEVGMVQKHEELDRHVDVEVRAMNAKIDLEVGVVKSAVVGITDDQKKWKWIAVGFSAAGTFFGTIIGWFVERNK